MFYFRLSLTLLNVVEILLPRVLIAEIAATAIKAAIKPYSMAVAPFEFLIILRKKVILISFYKGLCDHLSIYFHINYL